MPSDPLLAALGLALLFGFRHGFDYDHIAAITDIASVQKNTARAMRMGLWYALGHAATVTVLGVAVILFQLSLPEPIDALMERVVGVTLVALGIYVLWTTLFPRASHPHSHPHAPRTRVMLMVNGVLWLVWRVRQMFAKQPVPRHQLFGNGIGRAPSVVVGIIHGLGAETPSQLGIFLLAANLGGIGKGLLGVAMFIIGMLVMNTIMCAGAAGLFAVTGYRETAYRWIAGVSAAFSIGLGALFLAGPSVFANLAGQ